MKILIDIRSTLKKKTGVGHYTFHLVKGLTEIDRENKYYLYSRIGFFNTSKKLPQIKAPGFRHYVNRFKSHPLKFFRNMDVIYTSAFDFPKAGKAKLVLVVHDVIHKAYPQGHSKETIDEIEQRLLKILPLTDKIITSSEATGKDLVRFYQVSPEKIKVVYAGAPAVNEKFSPGYSRQVLKKYNITQPYILYVGTLEPRKNVEGLISAFKKIKGKIAHKLVIAGMKGWLYEGIFDLVSKERLGADVIFTGYVPEDDLLYLYKSAGVFVYPSFYEGVGLPVLEAFSYGAPVVTSNAPALAEMASDAAILTDPYDAGSIAEAIYNIISDGDLRQSLVSRGYERARQFDWKETARQTLDVFGSLKRGRF